MTELRPCVRNHPLTDWIFRGDGRRYCGQCKREREQSSDTQCKNNHLYAEHAGIDRKGRRYCRACNAANARKSKGKRTVAPAKPGAKAGKQSFKYRRGLPLCSATERAEIDLVCGHTVYYDQPSLFGEALYCNRHHEWFDVKDTRIVKRAATPTEDSIGALPNGRIMYQREGTSPGRYERSFYSAL